MMVVVVATPCMFEALCLPSPKVPVGFERLKPPPISQSHEEYIRRRMGGCFVIWGTKIYRNPDYLGQNTELWQGLGAKIERMTLNQVVTQH
ncbi:hypothetical protein HDV64DRAFT_253079 [Trichoderma sp. TUCIM 5745]